MRAALLIPVVLLASAPPPAAAPAPTRDQAAPPTFQSDTQVVLLDLVARDGKGRPVADLQSDELQVFEDGRRCDVQSFRLVRAPSPSRELPKTAPGPIAAGASAPGANAPAADEASTPGRANLVVLLFDRMLADTAPYARQGVLSLLEKPFPSNTWFAVFKVHTRGTILVQPFTADRTKLHAAVLAATTGDDARVLSQAQPAGADLQSLLSAEAAAADANTPPDAPPSAAMMDAISARVRAGLGDIAARVQAFDTLYGLQAIARSLEPVRGRKTVLYLAVDRQLPDSTSFAYESMVSAANRANVTIHTVDVRGLTAARVGGMSAFDQTIGNLSASGATGSGGIVTRSDEWAVDTAQPDTGGGPKGDGQKEMIKNPGSSLERMAGDTGGLSIRNTNDLGAGLVRVTEELGEYYEAVYVPPNPVPDGRFRRITAKVTRPGVRVRTRSGYFATPASAPTMLAYELPLTAAIASPDAAHDFRHVASVLHFGVKGREREALFEARVPLSEVRAVADEANGVYRAHLQLLGFVRDETGRAVARFSQDWPIEGPLRDRARLAHAQAAFRRPLSLPPGRYTVDTAVQDVEAHKVSVERSSLDVPAAAGALALGSLSVVRQASPATPGAAPDPLLVGGVAIQPHLGTAVLEAPVRDVPLFLPVYGATQVAAMELELWRGGERLTRDEPVLPPAEPDGRIAWIGSLPAKALPSGRYELVARVREGARQVEERATFEIRSAAASARAAAGTPGPGSTAAVPPPVPADLAPVLERAGRYVVEYEEKFQNIVAEETYTQWTQALRTTDTGLTLSCSATRCKRTTRADVVFARLAGAVPWGCFRDVFDVDGTRVRQEEGRLQALFARLPSATAQQRARILLDESARYNIGPALRNINFPTLALVFLHPSNQARFAWKRGGKRWFAGVETVEVAFEELARPTIVDQGGRGELPAKGRFWIDPSRGTVARSEARFFFDNRARAYVAAEYQPDPKLALWVPLEMREEYEDLPGAAQKVFGTPSEATARYTNYRRFQVTTEETAVAGAGTP